VKSRKATQQEKERKWLQQAQRICDSFPRGIFEQPDPPDILFRAQGIAIEITEYIRGQGNKGGSPERRIESLREEIVAAAQSKFEKKSAENLHVTVFWVGNAKLNKRDKGKISDQIVEIVSESVRASEAAYLIWRPGFRFAADRLRANYFVDVGIRRLNKSRCPWSCDDGGAIGDYGHLLQKTIDIKDPKIPTYAHTCREVWLLIVAVPHYLSTTFSPDEDFESASFQRRFHRVFVLDTFRDQMRELTLRH
jgi:hypothetical protein